MVVRSRHHGITAFCVPFLQHCVVAAGVSLPVRRRREDVPYKDSGERVVPLGRRSTLFFAWLLECWGLCSLVGGYVRNSGWFGVG